MTAASIAPVCAAECLLSYSAVVTTEFIVNGLILSRDALALPDGSLVTENTGRNSTNGLQKQSARTMVSVASNITTEPAEMITMSSQFQRWPFEHFDSSAVITTD